MRGRYGCRIESKTDMIVRSFKYRCYPNAQQVRTLQTWQSVCHEVQRLCILQRRIAWEKYTTLHNKAYVTKLPNWVSQSKELTALRSEYTYIADVPRDLLDEIVQRVEDAYTKMRRDRKNKKKSKVRWAHHAKDVGLTFKGATRGTYCIRSTDTFAWFYLSSAKKQLGALKVRMHRPIPDGATIKQAHLVYAADGWYISFSCTIPYTTTEPTNDVCTGVDLNVKHEENYQHVAMTDTGRSYKVPAGLKKSAQKLQVLQKSVSNRHVKGSAKHADPNSKRTAKRRVRIAKLHQKITRQRDHVQHYIARRLVDTSETIVFENLQHTAMRKRGKGSQKKGLNRALSTASHGKLIAKVQEKAELAGVTVVFVDAKNTTRACSVCGSLVGPQGMQGLSVRTWTCSECGTTHNRDQNAAQNIRMKFR